MTVKDSTSKGRLWTARIMSGLFTVFMLFDGITKLLKLESVIKPSMEMGFSVQHVVVIGVLGLISTILYAVPQTSIWGAVLITGYLGGAIVTHIRLDDPLFTHTLSPVYFAIIAWGGLYLRDERVRNLFRFQNTKHANESKVDHNLT